MSLLFREVIIKAKKPKKHETRMKGKAKRDNRRKTKVIKTKKNRVQPCLLKVEVQPVVKFLQAIALNFPGFSMPAIFTRSPLAIIGGCKELSKTRFSPILKIAICVVEVPFSVPLT